MLHMMFWIKIRLKFWFFIKKTINPVFLTTIVAGNLIIQSTHCLNVFFLNKHWDQLQRYEKIAHLCGS
jgi:hypothetical protein